MATPTAGSVRFVPARPTPPVVPVDHEGSSAETGVAVGLAVIPVETSEGDAGVAAVIPALISEAAAVRAPVAACCVPRPVLTSDAVTWAAGVAVPPGSAPSPPGDAIADPAPAAAIPAATVSTASVLRIP